MTILKEICDNHTRNYKHSMYNIRKFTKRCQWTNFKAFVEIVLVHIETGIMICFESPIEHHQKMERLINPFVIFLSLTFVPKILFLKISRIMPQITRLPKSSNHSKK